MFRASHTSPLPPRPMTRMSSWSGTTGSTTVRAATDNASRAGLAGSFMVLVPVSSGLIPQFLQPAHFFFEQRRNAVFDQVNLAYADPQRPGHFFHRPLLGHV